MSKGYGAVSNILAIVNEVPLAHWRIEAGLQLRQAMLLNCILFNSEAWYGVLYVDLNQLEKVDESLLRGLLKAHCKVLWSHYIWRLDVFLSDISSKVEDYHISTIFFRKIVRSLCVRYMKPRNMKLLTGIF